MAKPNTELTPMQRQYHEIKEKHKDCILFFRLGDFYEMFDEDAKLAARELDLTLTTRDRSKPKEEQTPMCGVPFHSVDSYIARLVQKGYKIAICEQMEDPATAKGLVQRDITRIVTPGTVTESCMLEESKNNYMGCIYGEGGKFGLSFCDVSTGAFYLTLCADAQSVASELGRFSPSEVLRFGTDVDAEPIEDALFRRLNCCVDEGTAPLFQLDPASELLEQHFGSDLAQLGIAGMPAAIIAGGALLQTLLNLQKNDLSHIRTLQKVYGTGSGCPEKSGADGNHAFQREEGNPALGSGQNPHRHGRTAAAQLAGKAPAGPGGNYPPPQRRGGAGGFRHCPG